MHATLSPSPARRARKRGGPPPPLFSGSLCFVDFTSREPIRLQRRRVRLRELLLGRCPSKPWCCDHFSQNAPRSLPAALGKKYIQLNPPNLLGFIVVDVDRAGAADAWQDAGLPPPTWCAINPKNGHAHLVWALEQPVWAGGENQRPGHFFKATEEAFRIKLAGDPGYAGLLSKNPISRAHHLHFPAGIRLYDLVYLSEFIDLPKRLRKRRETPEEGWRNCGVFDELRGWAYVAVSEFSDPATFGASCAVRAHQINAVLARPMDAGEVLHIARSVARWTWRKMGEGRGRAAFSQKQSERGKAGGRPRTTCVTGKPWEAEGISRATWYRRTRNP